MFFYKKDSAQIEGGDRACSPEPPLRFVMILYYLL